MNCPEPLPFVFVPGAYHGAWCFEKMLPLLRRAGAEARGVDLPLCPDKTTPVTMEACPAAMERATPAGGPPVLLCGHSMGGHFVSAFAERWPERVASLVYISATLLPDGCSAFDLPPVEKTRIKPRQQHNEVCKWYPVDSEEDFVAVWNYFYSGCARQDAAWAAARLQPQPFGSIGTKNHLTAGRFGSLPRDYVVCTRDPCNSPALQRAMAAAMPCRRMYEIPSGHSPFLAMPQQLAALLLGLRRDAAQDRH